MPTCCAASSVAARGHSHKTQHMCNLPSEAMEPLPRHALKRSVSLQMQTVSAAELTQTACGSTTASKELEAGHQAQHSAVVLCSSSNLLENIDTANGFNMVCIPVALACNLEYKHRDSLAASKVMLVALPKLSSIAEAQQQHPAAQQMQSEGQWRKATNGKGPCRCCNMFPVVNNGNHLPCHRQPLQTCNQTGSVHRWVLW